MKNFSQLISLLPCHSLEEFPERCSRQKAQNLLAAWTGLWHPELIAGAGKAPLWQPATNTVSSDTEAEQFRESLIHQHYYSDDHLDAGFEEADVEYDAEVFEQRWRGALVLIPEVAVPKVFAGFETAAAEAGAHLIQGWEGRSDLLSRIGVESEIAPEFADDFFALAYVRLQVELMTRKLRYSSDLDIDRFNENLVAAALAAKSGNDDEARRLLQVLFDQLSEEKNQYYPVAADLVDMVLLSERLRVESIKAELDSAGSKTLVMTGGMLRHLQNVAPDVVQGIKDGVSEDTVCVVAGPEHELPEDLLSLETTRHQLEKSVSAFSELLGTQPQIFMRRRAGLHASLPGFLVGNGFSSAIHATIDLGEIPESYSGNMRWMGTDGSSLMATGDTPLDASSDRSFLDLGVKIGRELDSAHVATVFFARWPTQTCDSLRDLRNATKYGSVLGDFTDAESYFDNVYDPGYGDAWEPDEYVGPWYEQACASGSNRPVSTFVDYWSNFYLLSATRNLHTMLAIQGISPPDDTEAKLNQYQDRIESQTKDWNAPTDESISNELNRLIVDLGGRLNARYINTVPWRQMSHLVFQSPRNGPGGYQGDDAIKFAARNASRCDAVVALSGLGLLQADPVTSIESSKLTEEPAVDDKDGVLRNEFFEVRMDPASGGIRGVHFYGKRGNLLSQQLAVRLVDSATKTATYSRMVCDSLDVVRLSRIVSEIRSCGRLVGQHGETLAQFNQTVSLARGRNVIDVEIELSDVSAMLALSDKNNIVNRIAWSDETGEVFCDMQGNRHSVRKPKIEAPHYIEVVQGENRFSLLTKGLPWHRRTSNKKLDTVLVAGNEARRKFKIGLAINAESSMQLAIAEMHPKPVFPDVEFDRSSNREASWLMHLANRNIVATTCEATFDEQGNASGLHVRFQETDGKAGTLKLYCRREIDAATKVSLDGEQRSDITMGSKESRKSSDYDVIETSFAAREIFEVQLSWTELNRE